MNHILRFEEPLARRAEYTGGKGANLALLTGGGFPVPPGFVLTASAYRAWLAAAGWWRAAVRDLPVGDPAALVAAAADLRHRLGGVPLPAAVGAEIREALRDQPAGGAFAVRSSSTMEDLADAAFAGQHDTTLNCLDEAQVLAAVKDCFVSLWHDRAIAYRHQQGLDHGAAAMAVVIQRMADCEVAGVAFSAHPVTGDLAVAVIEANRGLGESVVSGVCEVDHWEVARDTGEILARQVAEKSMQAVCAPAGGVVYEALAAAERGAPALADGQLAELVGMLDRVEKWFRFPQDLEWGYAAGGLVVLQARPITTIPPRWTRDESAERFPNAVTPLTWDFVDAGFRRSMAHSFRLMGFPRFSGAWFGKHGHYVYGNQNAVELYGRRFPFALDSLADLPTLIPRLREEFRWVQELPMHWSRDLDYYLIRLGEFVAEPLEGKSPGELWEHVLAVKDHGERYFLPNIAISITQSVLYRMVQFLLRELFGPEQVAPLMDGLLSFCETKTGAINKELYELAQLARTEPGLAELLRRTADNRELWDAGTLARDHPGFERRFRLFLRDHGHRETDFDIYHPGWAEAPWVVLDQVKLILDAPEASPPARRERDLKVRAQAAEFSVFQRLPGELHFFMHEILRLARVYTSLDDLEHYQTTRLAIPLRRGLRALGGRLVAMGVLADPMDLFFARERELAEAIKADEPGVWQRLAEAAAVAKASWLEAAGRAPGWVPEEVPAGFAPADPGARLTGLPGSPGLAEGEVFVVSGPQDFAAFPRGAILVARTTNPAWTPLFYAAGAVVTESGGPLSHGAVTAREMGIPAVMSVRGCLSRLANGCRVGVDGGRGWVTVLGEIAVETGPGTGSDSARLCLANGGGGNGMAGL